MFLSSLLIDGEHKSTSPYTVHTAYNDIATKQSTQCYDEPYNTVIIVQS
jgi:hypothetical protein